MTTSTHLVYLIALPLASAALLMLLGRIADKWGHLLATLISASTFAIAAAEFFAMRSRQGDARPAHQDLFTWISVGSFNVHASLLLDQLSICFVLLITGVGTLIHIYSIAYMSHDHDRRRFFSYLNLFVAAMLLLVLGDSYLNLYVGWEGVGLASYLLIGFWNQKPTYAVAAKKAFVANRVGDIGLSLAIMIAFAQFGSDLDAQTKAVLDKGDRFVELFKQPPTAPKSAEIQCALIWAMQNGFFNDLAVKSVSKASATLQEYLETSKPAVLSKIRAGEKIDDAGAAELKSACENWKRSFKA